MKDENQPITSQSRVLMMFHRIGPYHLARLRSANAESSGIVVGLEASDGDEIYAWDRIETGCVEKVTAFQGIDSSKLSRSSLLARFREVFRHESPIAVYVLGWTHLGIAGLIAASEQRIPVVIMSESSSRDFDRNPFKEWIKKRFVRSCSAGLVGGECHRDYLVKLGMPKQSIFLGYDAIDNHYFQQRLDGTSVGSSDLRKQYGLDKPFFLASNRFIPKKNLGTLYRAYARYREMMQDEAWDLVSLGDGDLKGQLEELRHELRLQSNIHMPGFIQYEELPQFYATAECFIHISAREQWGLVINEAMSSGLPIIVSDPCGAAELIEINENGWIVDPMNIELIAERMFAMTMLSEDQRSAMGKRSQEIIQDWGLERFGKGFAMSLTATLETPRPRLSSIDRSILRLALALT